MRTLCCRIFCGLAIVSFAVFIITHLFTLNISGDAIRFVIYTTLVTAGLVGLIWLAMRLWQARALIGRLLLALLIVLMVILVVTVPEWQQWAQSCLVALAAQPLLIAVLCVIICAVCCTWPGRQTS